MDSIAKQSYYESQLNSIIEDRIIRESYAKPSCKHCRGRGMINRVSNLEVCKCVLKNLKKEIETLG